MEIIFGSFWEIKYVLKYFVYYLERSPLQATVETLMCGSNRYLQEIKGDPWWLGNGGFNKALLRETNG